MRAKALATMALVLAACGSEPSPDAATGRGESGAAESNRAPELVALSIEPDEPTAEDRIRLAIEAVDPDRDELAVEIEWYVNGVAIEAGESREFPEELELSRGDEVFALVSVDDGESRVSRESERVTVRNRPPRVTSLRLLPDEPRGADHLMAVVEGTDPEGDALEFVHRWWRNGALIAGQTGPTLAPDQFRRRDEVRVEVAATDGFEQGTWVSSAVRTIANTPPRILSKPNYQMGGPSRYEYAIEADDQDGDTPLRYELVAGPKGMHVDVVTGQVTWLVPPGTTGVQNVEIAVSDPNGGQARQRYALDVRWEEPGARPAGSGAQPASTDEDAGEAPGGATGNAP
jgi:hypothetical protein